MDAIDQAVQVFLGVPDVLGTSSAQAADEVRQEQDRSAAIRMARRAIAELRDQALELLARLDDTDHGLTALEKTVNVDNFDAERWPQRREAIAAELAADPGKGGVAWLTSAVRAFLTGRPDEVDRLVDEPFALPVEVSWGPDRLSTAPDALRARSLPRLEPWLRYLAAGAPLGAGPAASGELQARALTLHARLLMSGSQPGAEALAAATELLESASRLDGSPEAEVLAAQAALARLGAPAAPAQAETAATLARRAWEAEHCVAAAVEMFYAGRGPVVEPPSLLNQARTLVDGIPDSGALEGALDLLVLPVPDEIWLAAALRAAREHDLAAGRRLVDRISSDAEPLLAAEAAELRVQIARDAGDPQQAVADLLSAAGLANAIAGRSQRAIDDYTEARQLVPDNQDATLGLADALLYDSWAKPLRDGIAELRQAVTLLDQEYRQRPLDTGTSWSLLTYSSLYTELVQQVVPHERAESLWQAALAAARVIAFVPSDASRWVRLSQALSSLFCLRAAAVAASQADRLAPDDLNVIRSRVATLVDVGDLRDTGAIDACLARLRRAQSDNPDAWYHMIHAAAMLLSARELSGEQAAAKLEQARKAADEAVRLEPQNLYYLQVRAEIAQRSGDAELAAKDFETMWQASRLDEVSGLSYAARAATELELGADAVAVCRQVVALAKVTAGDYDDYFNRGAALLLVGDGSGMADLETAVSIAATPSGIDYVRNRTVRLAGVLRGKDAAPDLSGIVQATEARAAQIEAERQTPPSGLIAAELDRVADNRFYSPAVKRTAALAVSLIRAWCGLALGDPEALSLLAEVAARHPEYPELSSAAKDLAADPLPGMDPNQAGPSAKPQPAPSEQVLQTYLPRSWFAGLDDPMNHELIRRFVPDARARLRRSTGATLPGVNFRDDVSLEPAGFRILLHESVVAEGWLGPDRWYLPATEGGALPADVRARLEPAPEAAGPDPFPVLTAFPAPENPDPLTALVAWPPAEVVTRRLELAFASWRDAQDRPAKSPQ